ncbi:MAG: hypothetical protein CVT98_05805 [Bacteroidetes bacterium HGW-Bacteroidetes-15]|nr:MAG: hypothetical protein CVT98_05805 [Bacteroidetes bacterium HGW-Bacteroidetes-15]
MKTPVIFDRYGGVTKEEPLSCIENELLLKNTCVLEADSPYFGYYNEVRHNSKPKMVYFVLDDYASLEKLMRATVAIQKEVKFPINAITGSITLHNQTCYVIRFLNLQNFSHIALLQEKYMNHGLVFKKKIKSFSNQMGIIKLRRFFSLVPVADGVYLEHEQPNFGYFQIPSYISWEDFKKLTTEVKYETELLYFDAASAFYYEICSVVDMVRIYRENLTVDKLKDIRHRYLKLIG